MPGSYAHITLVNESSEKRRLKNIPGFPSGAIEAANLHVRFLELGSISPDFPYLDIMSGDSKQWADAMHYTHTCAVVITGADRVRALPEGIAKEKCLAWLMGYMAHVVTDMCVHPVVELKVGPYKGHETAHRRCEMYQDAYIFRRIGTGMPQVSDHLRATIMTCGTSQDAKELDADIRATWQGILNHVYPDLFQSDPPDVNKWFRRCHTIMEQILPTSSRLVGFARHACDDKGLLYPTPAEVEQNKAEFITNLRVPSPPGQDNRMTYDAIFDQARDRVQQEWLNLSRYVLKLDDQLVLKNDEWDLDTGRDKSAENKLVYWEVA